MSDWDREQETPFSIEELCKMLRDGPYRREGRRTLRMMAQAADELERLSSAPVAPLSKFVAYLADHCEGQTVSEASLQEWLADILEDQELARTPESKPAVRGLVGSGTACTPSAGQSAPNSNESEWKQMPPTLTEEMHAAGVRTIVRCHGNADWPPRVYAAWRATAPTPPAAQPALSVGVIAPETTGKDEQQREDADRYRWAIDKEDNAEALYSSVISNAGDLAAINAEIDAERGVCANTPNMGAVNPQIQRLTDENARLRAALQEALVAGMGANLAAPDEDAPDAALG